MKRVDLFCVGPQRTASSWLNELLKQHPDVLLPKQVKEVMFFDKHFNKGMDWYYWHFDDPGPGQRLCEVAPTYFDDEHAVERIQQHNPDAKIVIAVRNPVVRCHSLFRHHLSKGRVPNNVEQALRLMPQILTSGKYKTHAQKWEQRFPGKVHYFDQESVRTEPETVLRQICEFAGISDFETIPDQLGERINVATAPTSRILARVFSASATALRACRLYWIIEIAKSAGLKKVFSGKTKPDPLTPEMHQYLLDYYREDIDWLREKMGKSYSTWNSFKTESSS